ncbi:MAG: hypothetical protein M3A44_07270 [Gammaproteobacteria bacterium]
MRHLKKAINELEAQIDQNKALACGQVCSLKQAVNRKITTPKVLIASLAGGLVLGLFAARRGRRGKVVDKSSAAECHAAGWSGKLDAFFPLIPLMISTVQACCGSGKVKCTSDAPC